MERTEFTADELEQLFHAALEAGDTRGVEAALTVMATKDPHRAQRLFDETKRALAVASRINGAARYCKVPVYQYGGYDTPEHCGEELPCRIHDKD